MIRTDTSSNTEFQVLGLDISNLTMNLEEVPDQTDLVNELPGEITRMEWSGNQHLGLKIFS